MYYGIANWVVINNKIDKSFRPYFYVCSSNVGEPTDLECLGYNGLSYSKSLGRARRVYVRTPAEVPRERAKHKYVSQSYIPYGLRISADLTGFDEVKIVSKTPGRVLAFDVEVTDKVIFGWTFGDEVVVGGKSDFLKAVEESDVVVGYNSWKFDMKYVGKEFPEYYINLKPHMDLYTIASGMFRSAFGLTEAGNALHEVAYSLGIMGIEEVRKKAKRFHISTLSSRELKEYIEMDVLTTYKLAEKWLPILYSLAASVGVDPMAVLQAAEKASPAILAEVMYHKKMEKLGYVLVDRARELEFEGGDKTRAVGPGLYRNVIEYDFHMMYPTTYYIHRVDPTSVTECSDGFEVKFESGVKRVCFNGGPIYEVMSSFYSARKKTKAMNDKALDTAMKILANSAYGAFGKRSLGIVCEPAAAFIFQYTEMIFDDLWNKYKPIYGDTDSIYASEELTDLNEYVKKFGDEYEMKREGVWDVLALVAKQGGGAAEKNYVKVRGDEVLIKGAKIKGHRLPRVLKYGGWREAILKAIRGGDLKRIIEEMIVKAKREDIYVEKSSMYRDIFFTENGRKTRLDPFSDIPILLSIGLERGKVDFVASERGGDLDIDPYAIYSSLFIPMSTSGDLKKYVIFLNNPYEVSAKVDYRKDARVSMVVKKISDTVARSISLSYVLSSDIYKTIRSAFSKEKIFEEKYL